MNPQVFLNELKNIEWKGKALTLLRDQSTDCLNVDIDIRDKTTNTSDINTWNRRVEQKLELELVGIGWNWNWNWSELVGIGIGIGQNWSRIGRNWSELVGIGMELIQND
ncbi:unnamed protein product [Adineta steineri]|uniref:Uncharacterized protein n=1 Tax=Adineta steineri TaxID=433720 RepID=A0A815RK32_9BILA|nr:unnamed protein product [Adineta steineri]CAF1637847.1 unnamed protein product [Adineta steineri]